MRPAGFRSHRGHPPVFSTPASATRTLPVHMSPRDDRTAISTLGLSLVPLQVSGAEDMVGVLGDDGSTSSIGGRPATIEGLPTVTPASSPAPPTRTRCG